MDQILEVRNLKKRFVERRIFGSGGHEVKAADDVSFGLDPGETLVLAGESGSGKSTIARLILGSEVPDSGSVLFEGGEVHSSGEGLGRIRLKCQMIHQDPYESINPRMKVGDIIAEPLEIHNIGDREGKQGRVREVLGEVHLEPAGEMASKYPHMLSGGQRQRVVLARALAPKPKVIIADEPVSMLDVSIRVEMLNMMRDLQRKHSMSFIYITHDLATARYFGQRIAILYRGRIVEIGPVGSVLLRPRHPYTQALIDAISEPDPANLHREKTIRISESRASAPGCRFMPRCPYVMESCAEEPGLRGVGDRHLVACHADLQ